MITKLSEMSYHRNEAIDKCFDLGVQFIKHFLKIIAEGKESRDFNYHCQEMQSWYDVVRDITLKPKDRSLTKDQLINWFFLRGSSTDILFKDDLVADLYEELFIRLLSSDSKVKDILEELL